MKDLLKYYEPCFFETFSPLSISLHNFEAAFHKTLYNGSFYTIATP